MTFSGAGFVVPAAFGHGDGGPHGSQQAGPAQGPPWGKGPGGGGPPGHDGGGPAGQQFGGGLPGQQFGGGPPGQQGGGPSGQQFPVGGPAPGGGHGNGNGNGHGDGNGDGHSNGDGHGNGNGGGPGFAAPQLPAAPAQIVQAVNQGQGNGAGHGNGNGHDNGNGHWNGNGNGHGNGHGNGNDSGRGPVAVTPASGPAARSTGSSSGNATGNGTGNGNGNTNGNGNGNGHGPNASVPAASVASATPAPPAAAAPTPPAPAALAPPATPVPASPSVAPVSAGHGPTVGLGHGVRSHRRTGSRRTAVTTSPSAAGGLGLKATGRTGPLSASLSSGATAPPNLVGALAPGTSTLGQPGSATRTATKAATARRHNTSLPSSILDPAGTVIERFINVIPTGVWIALAAALSLAALAGVAAVRSGRRFRIQAGEVAAVAAAAVTDPLTGVLNRRGFIEAAERELERAGRYDHPMALAFVDIRGLKAVNDTEGHLTGDRLLKRVTTLLRDSARTHDLVGRIGGDELAVLLAEQSVAGAAAMTQRVRAQVPAAQSDLRLSTPWDVTIGTATFPEDGDSLEELLAAADRRLYEQRGIQLT